MTTARVPSAGLQGAPGVENTETSHNELMIQGRYGEGEERTRCMGLLQKDAIMKDIGSNSYRSYEGFSQFATTILKINDSHLNIELPPSCEC